MSTRLPRVSRLRKGYRRSQVDAFLAAVEASLDGRDSPVSALEIRRAGFELARGGYRTADVDQLLDRLEERVVAAGRGGGRRGRLDPRAEVAYLREELTKPDGRRFPRAGALTSGYEVDDVDEFVERLVAALDSGRDVPAAAIRDVRFRPRRGGYAEDAVDDLLDRVLDLILVVAARRADVDEPGGRLVTAPPPAGGPDAPPASQL